jgi:nucleoside triphosphatase
MPKQQYPEPTVGALIFDPEGKFLLLKSHKWLGKYVIPGGHIELGETIEQALIREIKEETNLDIYDIEFLIFQEFIFDKTFWQKGHYIFFDHACKTDSTDVILNDEAEEYIWVSIEEGLVLPLDPYTRIVIETYLKRVARSQNSGDRM